MKTADDRKMPFNEAYFPYRRPGARREPVS